MLLSASIKHLLPKLAGARSSVKCSNTFYVPVDQAHDTQEINVNASFVQCTISSLVGLLFSTAALCKGENLGKCHLHWLIILSETLTAYICMWARKQLSEKNAWSSREPFHLSGSLFSIQACWMSWNVPKREHCLFSVVLSAFSLVKRLHVTSWVIFALYA